MEPSPLQRLPNSLLVSWIMMVAAVVAWRGGEFYSGGADPVVAAKAFLTGLALLVALTGPRTAGVPPLPVAPLAWLGAYLAVATLAALAGDLTLPSLILVVRLVITAAVVITLCGRYGALFALAGLCQAMMIVAGFAIVTGIGSISSGRLTGGVPAATPNEIAVLCCVPLVVLLQRWVRGTATSLDLVAIALLSAATWATGSRTGLAVVALAGLATYLLTRRISLSAFCALALGVPIVAYFALATPVLGAVFGRGGLEGVTTLSSRTIAWNAALHLADDFWSRSFGAGLALKQIPVPARFWSVQGLDSSWFSALVQVGWFGVALVVAWTLAAAFRGAVGERPALWVPLLMLLVLRASLESGLFDSSPAFLAFLVAVIGVWTTRPKPGDARSEVA